MKPKLQYQTRLGSDGKFQWRVRWTDGDWSDYEGSCDTHSDAEDEVIDRLQSMAAIRLAETQEEEVSFVSVPGPPEPEPKDELKEVLNLLK